MNDKIMFDRYYRINSKKTHRTEKMFVHVILQPYHNFLFINILDMGRGQVLFSWWFEGLACALRGGPESV